MKQKFSIFPALPAGRNFQFSNNNDGQALVEMLAAFVLMTFLLTGLVVAGLFAMRNAQYARNRSTATKLASEQLERARVFRDINGVESLNNCNDPCFINPQLTMVQVAPTSGIFTQSFDVAVPVGNECPLPTAGQVGSTIYKVTSDVSWDSTNPNRKVSVDTCLSDWK